MGHFFFPQVKFCNDLKDKVQSGRVYNVRLNFQRLNKYILKFEVVKKLYKLEFIYVILFLF